MKVLKIRRPVQYIYIYYFNLYLSLRYLNTHFRTMRKQHLPHWIHLRSRKPVLCDSGRKISKISAYEDDLTELVEVQNCHILKRDFETRSLK